MTIILRSRHEEYKIEMYRTANGGYGIIESGGTSDFHENKQFEDLNPLIAFNAMVCRIECIGRRKIGDFLEQNGRNRYTGRPTNETKK